MDITTKILEHMRHKMNSKQYKTKNLNHIGTWNSIRKHVRPELRYEQLPNSPQLSILLSCSHQSLFYSLPETTASARIILQQSQRGLITRAIQDITDHEGDDADEAVRAQPPTEITKGDRNGGIIRDEGEEIGVNAAG